MGRDHFADVAKALYTLPTTFIGQRLLARADQHTVRFYENGRLVKTHPRKPPGGKSIDASDFPPEKAPYALRDVAFLEKQPAQHGEAIGQYAKSILAGPLPWTRMRRVRKLLALVRKFDAARVEEACRLTLAAEMVDVQRLERMLKLPPRAPLPVEKPPAPVIPIARYLRPPSQYALPLASRERDTEGEKP